MATYTQIIANPQTRVKDTYAAAPSVGLVVRANGEEVTTVIDSFGHVVQAGIIPPSVAPTGAPSPTGGFMGQTGTTYVAYSYVYAATTAYPFVNAETAINGSLAPRSNPSPSSAAITIAGGTTSSVVVTVNNWTNVTGSPIYPPARNDITEIWIFRTQYYDTALEATTVADAGQVFYVGKLTNNPGAATQTFTDTAATTSIDQASLDNSIAPTFQFVVYYAPYWWGFGNFPFTASATWSGATPSIVTISAPNSWFPGRDGQIVSLSGITTGGFNGYGSFKFLWISSTTAYITLDGTVGTAQHLSAGSGTITIQGPAVTLYRSAPNNPFAWGFTEVIGTALVPQDYAFNVGGGMGTALAVIPNTGLLKLDTEYPARCYTLNLSQAGSSAFEQSLRIISETFSVSSHWSQFSAMTQNGISVLWGIDYKNFAILQCNGATQYPISFEVPVVLRRLTQDKSKQLSCHGVYDARTELNCLWVTTNDAVSQVNFLIYQHAPTGFWGFMDERDLLSSATIQDTLTGENKTFVGTQTGLFGQAFVSNLWSNWLPAAGVSPASGLFTGTFISATSTSITVATVVDPAYEFDTTNLVGIWCLVTDLNHENEQWARIASTTTYTLTFDAFYPYVGGVTTAFNPVPTTGLFYIGMIECLMEKRYDLDIPTTLKTMSEFWITQLHVDNPTLLRFYRELRTVPETQIIVDENTYLDGTTSDTWVSRIGAPNLASYSFGVRLIQRGYLNWKLVNFLYKTKDANN